MFRHFIAKKSFKNQIKCFCPDQHHASQITIHSGDIIELTRDRKFVHDQGWYFLISVNDDRHFYIALKDLENYYDSGHLVSLTDLELTEIYYQYKINEALDTGDHESFMVFTSEIKELKKLKEKITNHLYQSEA